MILSIFVLLAAICIQSDVVYSQQPQHSFGYSNPGAGYNPYSWEAPYNAAASNSWMDYIKKAQEVTNQLYKQWDKTGAGNMIGLGAQYAQQAAKEFEKYVKQPQQTVGKMPFF